MPVTEVPSRPLAALRPEVAAINAAAAASNYATLGETVPGLLGELHALGEIEPTGEVRELLGHTLHAAFYLAKDLGYGDLAWAVAGHRLAQRRIIGCGSRRVDRGHLGAQRGQRP